MDHTKKITTLGLAGVTALTLTMMSSTAAIAEGTVAFLMPDQASTRYEEHDYSGVQA